MLAAPKDGMYKGYYSNGHKTSLLNTAKSFKTNLNQTESDNRVGLFFFPKVSTIHTVKSAVLKMGVYVISG